MIVLAVLVYVGLVALAWVLLVAIVNGIAAQVIMDGLNNSFAAVNQETTAGNEPPATTLRSGVAGDMGCAGSAGSRLRRPRTERQGAVRVQRRPGGARADPQLCRIGQRR